ncbi:hypothetical protein M440DRAFT_1066849 [Trichoderma longibrachiatum ATCC 18648]|uniref:Uncharacterized protein n=1 Tax=Trichoderma longibrachiatum ATCC 18648 TaxID=983965 RepID=A0A2T4BWI9_TRILO|nr:hypothetical protein M440DRAFT_1066849 [Trichoderma longibrachiatum ATCC 18648]
MASQVEEIEFGVETSGAITAFGSTKETSSRGRSRGGRLDEGTRAGRTQTRTQTQTQDTKIQTRPRVEGTIRSEWRASGRVGRRQAGGGTLKGAMTEAHRGGSTETSTMHVSLQPTMVSGGRGGEAGKERRAMRQREKGRKGKVKKDSDLLLAGACGVGWPGLRDNERVEDWKGKKNQKRQRFSGGDGACGSRTVLVPGPSDRPSPRHSHEAISPPRSI